NIPVICIVGNDAGWGTERHRQTEMYGPDRLVASELLPQRYDRVAEALGAHGEYVERPQEIGPALDRALASGKPACINVAIASAGDGRHGGRSPWARRRGGGAGLLQCDDSRGRGASEGVPVVPGVDRARDRA